MGDILEKPAASMSPAALAAIVAASLVLSAIVLAWAAAPSSPKDSADARGAGFWRTT